MSCESNLVSVGRLNKCTQSDDDEGYSSLSEDLVRLIFREKPTDIIVYAVFLYRDGDRGRLWTYD